MTITVPISIGELYDKLTILEIKESKITNPEKLKNIRAELLELSLSSRHLYINIDYDELYNELKNVNLMIWDIENKIREKELRGELDDEFMAIARSVYVNNDRRYEIKNKINAKYSSYIIEEKSYNE